MPGFDQPIAVEADAFDGLAGEVRTEPGERLGAAVDDGDGVPAVEEGVAQRCPDPAAPDDDDVHAGSIGGGRRTAPTTRRSA